MRDDLAVGSVFPDLKLPEHTGKELALSEIANQQPLVLVVRARLVVPERAGARAAAR